MSCGIGESSCERPRRRAAFLVLAIMTLIFIALSAFSFLKSRGQVTPDTITYGKYTADQGKRVFQEYNCMGCHTIVGNGAYLGPDLTKEYKRTGPAWLAAFLPSAGGWPTAAAIRAHLHDQDQLADTGVDSLEAYMQKFPGAAERVQRRGGGNTEMPNLPLTQEQIGQLIAFLKYTSAMNTEGWPPKVEVTGFDHRVQLAHWLLPVAQAAAVVPPAAANNTPDPAALGEKLVKDNGCLACHSTGSNRVVGPGWGGLYQSQVHLEGGGTVTADDAYLHESIRQPNAKIVAGYPKGVMPVYDNSLLKDTDVNAIVAYLHTLEKQ